MKRETSPRSNGRELLGAYVDGVGELTPSERKRVELYLADEPGARDDEAATRDLIGELRDLAPQSEPDWAALERSIQGAIGDAVPQSWGRRAWARWRFAAPIGLALAGATAILVLALRGGAPVQPEHVPVVHVPADVEAPGPETDNPYNDTIAVYLDGTELELALEASGLADDTLDELTFAGLDDLDVTPGEHLLGEDLGWIDDLDDAALRRLEGLIERKNKGT